MILDLRTTNKKKRENEIKVAKKYWFQFRKSNILIFQSQSNHHGNKPSNGLVCAKYTTFKTTAAKPDKLRENPISPQVWLHSARLQLDI